MAARHYRLYYYDARGRVEFIRWLFAYTGQPFEDTRIDPDQQNRLQSNAPLGAFPYLEVDRKPLGEPLAIGRYLARIFNLAGKDPGEAAQIDALVDFLHGTASKLYSYIDDTIQMKSMDKGDALKSDIVNDLQKPVRRLEDVLLKNSRGDGFLMGLHPTWADLFLACFLESIEAVSLGFLETRPLLEAYFARVCSLKGIADWLSKRPETPY